MVNFNLVFGLRNRPRGLKRFSCFSRKRTDLSKKKLHGVCTLTRVYQYAKEERFLFFESCRTLVDICVELLLNQAQGLHYRNDMYVIGLLQFILSFCFFSWK